MPADTVPPRNARTSLNRRELLILPALTGLYAADSSIPWQRKIRRVGQTNMTEHDPVVLDVEQWADYWASLKVDAVLVSVTGILAFYQTKVPFHRKGKYLGDRIVLSHVDLPYPADPALPWHLRLRGLRGQKRAGHGAGR